MVWPLCISSICVSSLHILRLVQCGLPKLAIDDTGITGGGEHGRTFVKTTSTIYIIFATRAPILGILITDAYPKCLSLNSSLGVADTRWEDLQHHVSVSAAAAGNFGIGFIPGSLFGTGGRFILPRAPKR